MPASRPIAVAARRRVRPLLAIAAALAVVLGTAGPAYATTAAEKLAVLSSFSQTTAGSYQSWNAARQDQGTWSSYGYDWSTDFCSASPDKPLGFDFTLSCHRHDFGYRNHKALGVFTSANKSRVDDAFYADLKRKCATYGSGVRPACLSLAWTYYQAVSIFGSTAAVDEADLRAAAALV